MGTGMGNFVSLLSPGWPWPWSSTQAQGFALQQQDLCIGGLHRKSRESSSEKGPRPVDYQEIFLSVRNEKVGIMDDYEVEEKKQAAADALMHYSQFAMACIGEGVPPSKLRLHLLKEISGMPTTLKKEYPQQGSPSTASNTATVDKTDHASSSATTAAKSG